MRNTQCHHKKKSNITVRGKKRRVVDTIELSSQLKAQRERAYERRVARRHKQALRKQREEELRNRQEREAARRIERWQELCAWADELGITPSPQWSETDFEEAINSLLRERERRRSDKEQSIWRNQKLRQIENEAVESEWQHIPHIVKFGDLDRGAKNQYFRGDLASYNREWQSKGGGQERKVQDRLRCEHEAQTGILKRGRMGKGPHNPQKQPRGWKAKVPRKWRRKAYCEARWDHLFT